MNSPPDRPIRVLLVEDSETERRLLEHIVGADPRLTVADVARTGEATLRMLGRLQPDVISMDIRLPGIDGIETTKSIMRHRPTPIVVVASDAGRDSQLYFDALRAGALSIVEKPRASSNPDFAPIAARLCRQLVLMSEINLVRRRGAEPMAKAARPVSPPAPSAYLPGSADLAALGIAASTGGPVALAEILSGLDEGFPAPIFVVQHIGPAFCQGFVDWLNTLVPLPVKLAAHGKRPRPGSVYVAPAETHLECRQNLMALTREAPVSRQRPSGTVLFRSLAREFGAASIGVLLTGMGDDGAAGLAAIKDAGGYAIAEDKSTAVVFGMPGAALELGAVTEMLPLAEIVPRIRRLIAERIQAAS